MECGETILGLSQIRKTAGEISIHSSPPGAASTIPGEVPGYRFVSGRGALSERYSFIF